MPTLLARLRPLSSRWPYAVVACCFVASRVVYRSVLDVAFDATPVNYFIQSVDPQLLRTDLVRSILHLHHQAPLQNLMVGLALKVFGVHAFAALDWVYLAMGLVLGEALVHAMLRLRVHAGLAAFAASAFIAWPATVIYESWLFYTFPTAMLLVIALCALLRFYRLKSFAAGLAFFASLAVVGLLRATYGPLWMCVIAAALLVRPPTSRMLVLKAVAIPLVVLGLNVAKTHYLTGHGYGDALLWPNLARKMYKQMPVSEIDRLIKDKSITKVTKIPPFSSLSSYRGYRVPHEPTGVPLLDLETKIGNKSVNTHAIEHVLIAEKHYKPDALVLLKRYPDQYRAAVWRAISVEWVKSSMDGICRKGRASSKFANCVKLRGVITRCRALGGPGDENQLLVLMFALPLTVGYGVVRLVRARNATRDEAAMFGALALMLITVAYVTSVSVLVSYGEFSRYRFDIDPFHVVLLALAVQSAAAGVRRFGARLGSRGAAPPSTTSSPGPSPLRASSRAA